MPCEFDVYDFRTIVLLTLMYCHLLKRNRQVFFISNSYKIALDISLDFIIIPA